ncbi:hypothetical protein Vadar_014111 [Vaccinium darrowii]|uniref:Uncharacterized protein n=1 Tax=Vaccinium darrowii TaxID=229202 RepID=A0ACB7Z3M2_9ERIC|nr:hypothetical protein Vadar_014111 [Vaccinium darrowii]
MVSLETKLQQMEEIMPRLLVIAALLNGSISINEFDGLNNLKELDLSSNRLRSIITVNGSQEESGILNELEDLDLSHNDLNDSIWSFLKELSSIKTLDLSGNHGLHGAIHNLAKLSSIENLFMDGATLGDDFLPNIRIMTSIRVLSLRDCALNRILPIEGLCELKTLRELDVTRTGFGGSLPWCLVNLTSLQLLDITSNHFNGNIARSPLINLTSLEYLAISNNDFEIPISFKSFFNHSKLMLVESLNNKLLEDQEDIFATPPRFQLILLSLSNSEHGRITGSFPQFLYHQHEFIVVELSGFVFTGMFPYWLLENNTNMETLLLSSNSIGGPLLLPSRQMRNLKKLDISNNHLEGFIPYNIASSFPSLKFLNMSTNNFDGNISSSFRDMTTLLLLDLSSNHLEGPITIEFCELKGLSMLYLSENSLTGVIPSCFNSSYISNIRLSKNRLHGPFPTAFQNLSSIMELDLSYNQFSGNIPTWIDSLSLLSILFLQHNHFEGNIPKELCHLSMLTLIDFSFNNFFGSIPPCIGEFDFGGFNGQLLMDWILYRPTLPFSLENRFHDTIIDTPAIQEVEFETKGLTLSYKGIVLYLFSGINLSHNRLTGPIPPEIGNLSHIEVLNFSHNHLTGTIPATFSNLKSIESLDLSYNNLSGKIPSQLTELYSLEVFDLSNNNLSGRTPQRVFQFATFESSSYDGNPLLCGEPLPKKCNADYSPPPMPRAAINGSEEDSGFIDMDTFYMSFAGSYLAVVLAIVAILFINPYWRRAWFHLIEVFLTSSYYFVVDNLVYPVRGFLWK